MKETNIKGWDKTCITKVFLLAFQLVAMEANVATPLSRNQ
jgi:hypothetical protein